MIEAEAIIFDFDGVLVESVEIKGEAFVALYEDESAEIQAAVLAYHNAHGGVTRYDKIRYYESELCGRAVTEERVQELAQRFSDIVEAKVKASPWVAGARAALEHFSECVPLYIASATPEEELLRITSARGMDDYFKGIYGTPKTKSEHLAAIIAAGGFNPARVVMIGDAMSDYKAAQDNATHFIGRKLPGKDAPFPGGTTLIDDLTPLTEMINAGR